MAGFLGEYEATLDAKGRFLLPVGFKKQLEEENDKRFVINRGMEKYLSLYPYKTWEAIFNELNNLSDFDPEIRQFKRFFLNGATLMELDAAGRLLVPQNLKPHAELERDIVLLATGKLIEVWDKSKYTKFFAEFPTESVSSWANKHLNKKQNVATDS